MQGGEPSGDAEMVVSFNQKQKIEPIHLNLVDLVNTCGHNVEFFSSLEEHREYTVESGKFFPRESTYAGGLLKFLLRVIF